MPSIESRLSIDVVSLPGDQILRSLVVGRNVQVGYLRAALVLLGDPLDRGGLGDVVGDTDVEQAEGGRQQDDQHAQTGEDDRRMRHLVADPLDPVEQSSPTPLRLCADAGAGAGTVAVTAALPRPAER